MHSPGLGELPDPPRGKTGWPWTDEPPTPLDVKGNGESWPRITVVTPSYNQGPFIEETIRSVLLQGYPNLEYIVIDGGSVDESVSIIRKYERWLAYWASEPDGGQAEAINKGFLKSTGDILGWQNSDDIYLPSALFSVAEVFRSEPTASLVFGNIKFIDEDQAEQGELRFVPFTRWSLIHEGTMLANQASFWRRELFFQVGSLDTSLVFCMDYDFFLRASFHGRFKFLRRFLGAFRIHGKSKSSTLSQVGAREHAEVLRRVHVAQNGSRSGRAWKAVSAGRRAVYYAMQGDLKYLVRGAAQRWNGSLERSGSV